MTEIWRDESWKQRTADKADAPNYKEKSDVPNQRCGNCRNFQSGTCNLYNFKTKTGAWCSSWADGKYYGWYGGGRFPLHGVPPPKPPPNGDGTMPPTNGDGTMPPGNGGTPGNGGGNGTGTP